MEVFIENLLKTMFVKSVYVVVYENKVDMKTKK